MIVDEAHHVAPAAPVKQHGYPKDSKQTEAVRRLAEHAQHRLFPSATPHNGYSWSWQALLEMLDPQRFFKGQEPDKNVLAQVMVRRLKTDIKNPDESPNTQESTAFVLTHEDNNFIGTTPCVQLAQRGYTVMCVKSEFNDQALASFDALALDVGSSVKVPARGSGSSLGKGSARVGTGSSSG